MSRSQPIPRRSLKAVVAGWFVFGCTQATPEVRWADAEREWQQVRSVYDADCAATDRLRSTHERGPTRLCSRRDRPLPTVVRGENLIFAAFVARASGNEVAVVTATERLVETTQELRAGARGWLAEDMLR